MDTKSQAVINKTWGSFWADEKKQLSGELVHIEDADEPVRVAKKFFSHKVFYVGYPVFKKYLPNKPGQVILDVGTGSGRYGLKVAMDFPESTVVMTDVVPEALVYAESMAKKLRLTNIETKKEDGLKLSFPDATFDVVMCDAVIQYIPEYEKVVHEMARVLKPSGRLILSTVNVWNIPHTLHKWWVGKNYPHGWEKSFSHRELSELLEKNGVTVVAKDGYYFAYGIYRLGYHHKTLRFVAKATNRISKMIDRLIGGAINRNMGFQIIVAGKKKSH